MKKIFSLLLVVSLLVTVLVPVSATEEQAKLIYSYDSFEAKDKSILSGSMRKGYEYSTDYAKTGNVSLKAVGSEGQTGGWLWIKNFATFEKGKTYTVRFFAMSDELDAGITAELFISGGSSVTGSGGSRAIPIGEWGEFVAHYKWDKDETTAGSILLKFGGESNIYVDDLEVYEGKYIKQETDEDTTFTEITPGSDAMNLYVDTSANGNGDGSKASPFNTIEAAQNHVRTINSNMTRDIVVNLKGGNYELEKTIKLTDEDSGTNGHYVIYQPYGYDTNEEENVVLSGGKKVTGWTQSEIAGVYKAPLDVDYLRNLYVNDKLAQRARYNEYVTPISWWDDTEDKLSTKDGFVIPGGIIKNPDKATKLEIYRTATFRSNWAVKGTAVADGENTIIKMEQPWFYMHEYANLSVLEWKIENNFRLENALEFLDEPGEWYHDDDTDTLYYMPRDGESIESSEVIAPNTEQLLVIAGGGISRRAENIIVRGLTFAHGAYKKTSRLGRVNLQATACYSVDAAGSGYVGSQFTMVGNINILNAKNVSLRDNVIKHMSSVAVTLPNSAENCELDGNVIYNISSSAITIGTNKLDRVTDNVIVPKNINITNNVIGKTGIEYESDPGIQGYYTNGLRISHNEVYDAAYSGICVGWGWANTGIDTKKNNVIEYNRIYNYGTACQDGGAIYTLGKQPNSAVHGNYILSYEQDIVGIYHDEASAFFTTTGNVVDMPADSVSSGLYNHSFGDDLLITRNYTNIVNSTASMSNFSDNFIAQGITRSPEALKIRETAGIKDEYKSIRNKIADYSDNAKIQRIYLQTEEQNHQTPADIKVGESLTLVAFAESRNGEISKINSGLTFKVSDSSVLSINDNKVTAVSEGISNVTVTDAAGNSAMMQVTVGDEMVSFEVIANKHWTKSGETINVGYRLKTKYTEYIGVPNKSALSVEPTSVLKVVSDGTLTALAEGKSTVTVNVKCGKFTASGTTEITVSDSAYRTFKKLALNSMLTKDEILSALGGKENSAVTEKTFVDVLASIVQVESDKICKDASNDTLIKEEMVAYVADCLVSLYDKTRMYDTELHQYTDRADINPSLVPKIALAYEYGLLSWLETSLAFEPKKAMTQGTAADFLYRFARPEKFEYLRKDETRLSTYETVAEWLVKRDYPGMYAKAKQIDYNAPGEKAIEIANTVHNGTDGSAIIEGELVQKITKSVSSTDNTIYLINGTDFIPGKRYTLSFKVKLSHEGILASNKNTFSIEPQFTRTEDSDSISTEINSSSWTDINYSFGIPEDAEYPLTGNTSIWIRMKNTSKLDFNYYDVYFKDMVMTETADATITSSTIADGEQNVMTPVDSIYIRTSGALDSKTVTTDKFTLTGGSATVLAVDAIDETTIKVSLSGTEPSTEYTLTVSGVATPTGGILNGSISWTTAPINLGKTGVLDFEKDTTGFSGDSGINSTIRSEDYAYSGKSSAKITTNGHANMYVSGRYAGFEKFELGKKYLISYWVYSPNKAMRTGMYKHGGDRFIEYVTVPKGEWTQITGVFEPSTAEYQIKDLFMMQVYDLTPDVCYMDDIRISEFAEYPVTVHRPNIFTNGIPSSDISSGNNRIEMVISGSDKAQEIMTTVAQYDENGKMVKIVTAEETIAANENKTVVINLPNAQDLKTKMFVVDKETFKPLSQAIEWIK